MRSPHFCRVGKIKPNAAKILSLKELEKKVSNFVEDISKFEYTDIANANF